MSERVGYNNCIEEVATLIKARAPIIWVVTHEEGRFFEELRHELQPKRMNKELWTWSVSQGLIKITDQNASEETIPQRASGENKGTIKPSEALQKIVEIQHSKDQKGIVFLLKDFHSVLVEPHLRQIRDMYGFLTGCAKTIMIVSPVLTHGPGGREQGLPPTLEKQINVVEYGLPKVDAIKDYITDTLGYMKVKHKNVNKYKIDYTEQELAEFAKALTGLTMVEAATSVATSFSHMRAINVEKLIQDKRQIIRKSQTLEFIDDPVTMDDIGGLDQAKSYLAKYALANTDEAKEYGVEPLRGILLIGVPGSGKSALTKAIRSLWKLPLLQLDIGRVMGSLVGQSESRMREVIQQSEAMSPCILLVDEVEKGLAGTKSSNHTDGGTLARVFGTLLTAMQDRMHGVTVIATANSIELLPPEFIRRFNEVFFVDLPGPDERWEIFNIHLSKRGRDISNFIKHKNALLDASANYTGAEIEKAIKDAIAAAFYAKRKNVTHKDLLTALKDTKPISTVMADKIKTIRNKAKGQYRFASSWSEQQLSGNKVSSSKGKALDVDSTCNEMNEFIKSDKKKKQPNVKNRFEDLE